MTHLEVHPAHWPYQRPLGPLDATHASHISSRANPGRGQHTTRILVLSVRNTVAEAVGSREEARHKNAVAAPDGQRQSGRGGPVRSAACLKCRGSFPSRFGWGAKT
jgi:hypothetical protein